MRSSTTVRNGWILGLNLRFSADHLTSKFHLHWFQVRRCPSHRVQNGVIHSSCIWGRICAGCSRGGSMVRKPSSSSTTTGRPRSSLLRGTSSLWYGRRALAINPRPLWAWAGKGGPGAQWCPLRTRWDRGPKGPGCEASSRSQQGFNFKGGCAAC
jgi:hypothetical protein